MRWIIDDGLRSQLPFSEVNISETLYEFEGPKIFTAHSHGLLTLWYEAAEDSDGQRYLVVPTEAAAVEKLKKGIRTVHDALSQSWLWAVDTSPAMEITAGWALGGLGTVPAECKPSRDVTLLRENEPLISYRLIGENLSEGKVPASVIIRALARPTTALKRLLEISNDAAPHGGRPPETFRKVYDLNAQRFSFNSFEVALSHLTRMSRDCCWATSPCMRRPEGA